MQLRCSETHTHVSSLIGTVASQSNAPGWLSASTQEGLVELSK